MARRSSRLSFPHMAVFGALGLLLLGPAAARGQIYVAPDGSDLNPGTLAEPYRTIGKAHAVAVAGDTIFLRGGLYDSLTATITLSKSGSPTSRFHLRAYANERPLLDFSLMTVSSSNRGIRLSGNYWHIKGVDIRGAGDNGMHVSGSQNIIEYCSFYENHDTGLQLSNGAASNQVINCDSYHNEDPSQGNADGFAAKLDVGTGNSFVGCRAWENSDDGYDGYLRPSNDVTTTLEECWIFRNGYLKDGSPSSGNGNGFKMGGSDDRTLRHHVILQKCLAFDNRVKGFDQNNNRGSMTLYNCTAYRNGTNYSISGALDPGQTLTLVNCVALGSYGSIGSFAIQQTNSWLPSFDATEADFESIDTAGVRGPRQVDGSLPHVAFLHLAQGSDLIDAGTDVGIPYNGLAPDLGAFETDDVTGVIAEASAPQGFRVLQNYPNPFNPSTTIVYQIPEPGGVTIQIVDLTGKGVALLHADHAGPGEYRLQWDGTGTGGTPVAAGVYFAAVRFGLHRTVLKLQLVR
jgi:hypothetical protein